MGIDRWWHKLWARKARPYRIDCGDWVLRDVGAIIRLIPCGGTYPASPISRQGFPMIWPLTQEKIAVRPIMS
jgi:hypothetical protein